MQGLEISPFVLASKALLAKSETVQLYIVPKIALLDSKIKSLCVAMIKVVDLMHDSHNLWNLSQ